MGWLDRLEENATRFGESARKVAETAPGQLVGESYRNLRALFAEEDGQSLSAERFLVVFVRAVRADEQAESREARDVYVTARKRRRRLAMASFGAGPLMGLANQLADLYCETATVCDVAALHGLGLSDEQVGAHMLLLWGVIDSHEVATRAMAGEPSLTRLLAGRLREQAGEQLPDTLTKRSLAKALWDVRSTVGEIRKGATTDAVQSFAFTGHRTKKLIRRTESQLGIAGDGRQPDRGGALASIDPSSPEFAAALERAGIPPTSSVLVQLRAACASVGDEDPAVLDVSRAQWGSETQGPEEVMVVLLRRLVVLVAMEKRGLFGTPQPRSRPVALADYSAVAEDDEVFGHSVFFLAPDEDDHFLLSWTDIGERRRMFEAIFDAHAGRYGRWGVQLDPADYGHDFDRFHAQAVAEGPDTGRGFGVFEWAERRFGEFEISNALGFAIEWRGCELDDLAGGETSRRVSRLGHPEPWIDTGPEAERVFLRLGEQLHDEGLLDGPYDERTFSTEEAITASDAGPARLIALMNLAALARRFEHSRAQEWETKARGGIPSVPPGVFSRSLRETWASVCALPSDEGP